MPPHRADGAVMARTGKKTPSRNNRALVLSEHVFQCLEGSDFDSLVSRLGLEDHFFACKGIDTLSGFSCRLSHHPDFDETWHGELPWPASTDVSFHQSAEFVEYRSDILTGHARLIGNVSQNLCFGRRSGSGRLLA